MRTLKVTNGELVFKNNSLVWLEGKDAVIQRIANRLRLWKSEWFLSLDDGIDWLDIFNSQVLPGRIKATVKRELLKDKYVDEIVQLDVTFIRERRTLKINFKALGSLGESQGSVEL